MRRSNSGINKLRDLHEKLQLEIIEEETVIIDHSNNDESQEVNHENDTNLNEDGMQEIIENATNLATNLSKIV